MPKETAAAVRRYHGQRDPITLGVPASLGVSSFDEAIARKIPLPPVKADPLAIPSPGS